MKRLAILALLGVNLALVAALLITATASDARAQAFGGHPDYLIVNGPFDDRADAIYIIDQAKHRMVAVGIDRAQQEFRIFRNSRRNLRRDSGTEKD